MSEFSSAWKARFGGEAPMDLPELTATMARKSARGFLPDPLAEELKAALLGVAQCAATTCGLQMWSAVEVQLDQRERLWELTGKQDHVRAAPWVLCFCADHARAHQISADPAGLGTLEFFLMAAMDACFASERLCTSAEQLGLATCYVGSIRNRMPEVCELLSLPDRVAPLFLLLVGREDPADPTPLRPRLSPEAIRQPGGLDETYDARMRPYFDQMSRPSELSWSERLENRLREHHQRGRGHLVSWLRARGFDLE